MTEPPRAVEATTAVLRRPHPVGTPLYYAVHGEQRPDTFYSSEVGDTDDAVILLRQGPPDEDVNEVLQLDRNGNPLWSTLAMNGRDELTDVRARGAMIAAAGTRYLGSEEESTGEELDVWGFSPAGQALFEYTGPAYTSGGPVDVCADGTVIAGGEGTLPGSTTSGAFLVALDRTGQATWTAALPGVTLTKVTCGGDGIIRVAGWGASGAFAAQVEADGRVDWTWNGTEALSTSGSMGIDGAGDVVVASTVKTSDGASRVVVYSLDAAGRLAWSWRSAGPSATSRARSKPSACEACSKHCTTGA